MLKSLLSGRIKLKVSIFMMLIFLIFWLIALSSLMYSYGQYRESKRSYDRLQLLHTIADVCTLISRERGPANIAMTDFTSNHELSKKELEVFRSGLDLVMEHAIDQFENAQEYDLAEKIKNDLRPKLQDARLKVDAFIDLDVELKNKKEMDAAILTMFDVWDESHSLLKQFLYRYQGHDKNTIDLFNVTLIITELREQAGRLGSNIIAPLIFGNQLPEVNADRALRNQKNIQFLWLMLEAIDGKFDQDQHYLDLEKKVETIYIQQGLSYVGDLLEKNHKNPNHVLEGRTFTQHYVKTMSHVVNLQEYIAVASKESIEYEKRSAFNKFITTLTLVLIANIVIALMLYLLNYRIFAPLLFVREQLLKVLKNEKGLKSDVNLDHNYEVNALFDIIHQIQITMENSDQMEQKLRVLADTDALTGLHNRTALNKKIDDLKNNIQGLKAYSLLIIDIDNFKKINDHHGHLVGDKAIIRIARHMQDFIREEDFAVRYGGDELLILLKNTNKDIVMKIAERLREKVQSYPLYLEQQLVIDLSVSIGVAMGFKDWPTLMHEADLALLKAKKHGKNNVQYYA